MNQVPDSQANDRAQILSAEDLRKTYGNRVALKSLSFSLKAGARPGLPGSEWRRQDDFDTNSDPTTISGRRPGTLSWTVSARSILRRSVAE